ncbi:MAG: VOC family protein [Candidatus Dojkabacteria bacterium]
MNSYFYHIQTNIKFENKQFYKDLFAFMGWSSIFEIEDVFGFKSKKNGDIWFVDTERTNKQDYDDIGVNHISLRVDELKNVDEITALLKEKGISTLFGTPKHRTEFTDESQTYYQIMFESPDKILFEIVYIGAK